MNQERHPYIFLHGHCHGNWPTGKPNNKWLDSIKEYCSDLGITLYETTQLAENRGYGRDTLFTVWVASMQWLCSCHWGIKATQIKNILCYVNTARNLIIHQAPVAAAAEQFQLNCHSFCVLNSQVNPTTEHWAPLYWGWLHLVALQ